jgi:predicted NBD/HSP70 family sugar kinase
MTGRLLLLTLGTGVGSIVIDDGGKALEVEGGTSGHLGQIDVSIAGHEVIGPDGGAGGLEGYIGVGALRRAYGEDVSEAIGQFTGREPAMQALVRAIRIAHAIYRPMHVCLGGGIGIRLKHLLPALKEMIDKNLTSVARPDYTLSCGDDDFHSARGVAMMAWAGIGNPRGAGG